MLPVLTPERFKGDWGRNFVLIVPSVKIRGEVDETSE